MPRATSLLFCREGAASEFLDARKKIGQDCGQEFLRAYGQGQ